MTSVGFFRHVFQECFQTLGQLLRDRRYDLTCVGLLEAVDLGDSDDEEVKQDAGRLGPGHGSSTSHGWHVTGLADWASAAQPLLEQRAVLVGQLPHQVCVLCVWELDAPNHYVSGLVEVLAEERVVTHDTLFAVQLPVKHVLLLTLSPLRMTDTKDLVLLQKRVRVETFVHSELQFNPTTHVYVPRHELLPRADALAVLRALNTTPAQCPRILQSDIIARYYGAQVGDLFAIHRCDAKTGERETSFRMVVPPS